MAAYTWLDVRPLAVLTAALLAGAWGSPRAARGEEPLGALHFANDILPVLTKYGCNSGGCHGRAAGQNGFKLSLFGFDPAVDYSAIVEDGRGRRVSWGVPEESLLLAKPTGELPHGGGVRLEAGDAAYRLVRDWIAAGSPWGDEAAPKLVGIDVSPAEQVVSPDEKVPLSVTARYSDGSTRDVTAVAEYFSQTPTYVEVDATGRVRALGERGDGAVSVRYLGHVAVARFLIPYRGDLPESAQAEFQPKDFIDRLVLEKWRKLGIAPSPPAGDAEFLRRVMLDTIGTLPKPSEVREFLADSSPNKREALIERLLAREEFGIFWGQRWGDILRNKQYDAAQKDNSQKFTLWLRQAFAGNMPFDRFTRELICVTGKLEDQPQMDWYRQINNPQNRVEDTAQVFLGVRVSCANCHDHPFERISQNDYWQYAAFFARVDAISYGTVKTVGIKEEGETLNPRTGKTMIPKAFRGPEVPHVKGEDARKQLVDWMVAKDNPYYARALVNRYWAHYLKRGLIEAVDDLRATNPATNPRLLDALAADFVAHGYDIKHLTRTILNSRVYGLSCLPREENRSDRQNYARHYPQRLAPHVLMDALAVATGRSTKFTLFPETKRAIELPTELEANDFLDIFGRTKRDTPCVCETRLEPNLSQVLYLMFSPELQADIAHPEGTVATLVKASKPTAEIVEELYLMTLSRPPKPEESRDAIATIDATEPKQPAVEDLLWTLLNTKEFVFNH